MELVRTDRLASRDVSGVVGVAVGYQCESCWVDVAVRSFVLDGSVDRALEVLQQMFDGVPMREVVGRVESAEVCDGVADVWT